MRDSDWTNSIVLAEWAEEECRHLDLIASWEILLSVYEALGFAGPDNDDARLAEFKKVIAELNKFLTRMKTGLAKVRDPEAAVEFLSMYANSDVNAIRDRPGIAYNKLKQQWIAQSIDVLLYAVENAIDEGERDD